MSSRTGVRTDSERAKSQKGQDIVDNDIYLRTEETMHLEEYSSNVWCSCEEVRCRSIVIIRLFCVCIYSKFSWIHFFYCTHRHSLRSYSFDGFETPSKSSLRLIDNLTLRVETNSKLTLVTLNVKAVHIRVTTFQLFLGRSSSCALYTIQIFRISWWKIEEPSSNCNLVCYINLLTNTLAKSMNRSPPPIAMGYISLMQWISLFLGWAKY